MKSRDKNLFAALVLTLAATSALAHAQLERASPPVGGTVTDSPPEIRLQFSERVEPRLSVIALANGTGVAVPVGKPAVDPANTAVLIAKVSRRLAPGAYTVSWRAVSVDTHRMQGSFSFMVGR